MSEWQEFNAKPIEILLVEDNPGDIRLIQEAFREEKIINKMQIVNDGEEAVDYIFGRGSHVGRVLPDLVILDLNLPKKDGREVLREVKNDEKMKMIPVIILTSSRAEEDIVKSYMSHANCYIAKPTDFEKFTDVVKRIENFWFTVVSLPPTMKG
ncbi:MAG: response regulator [Deltaproteobacteria bacterium]|nr:response regulator [Deltaproteobacteria bacterium]